MIKYDSYYWKIWSLVLKTFQNIKFKDLLEEQYGCIHTLLKLRVPIPNSISCMVHCRCPNYCNLSGASLITSRMLDLANIVYSKELTINVIVSKLSKKSQGKGKRNDYPSVCVVCKQNSSDDIFFGVSEKGKNNSKTGIVSYGYKRWFANIIRKKQVQSLSGIILCKNKPGHCAEPHAADKAIRKKSISKLNSIEFSVPLRPRTMQVKAYCENCQELFLYCKNHNPMQCHCNNEICKNN